MVSHTFVFEIAVLNQIMQCGCHKIDSITAWASIWHGALATAHVLFANTTRTVQQPGSSHNRTVVKPAILFRKRFV